MTRHPDESDAVEPVAGIPYAGLAGFRAAIRTFLRHSEDITKAVGVTSPQYQALLAIRARPGDPSVRELADELLLLPHGALQLVNRLEALGLVNRRRAEDDARKVLLSLTPDGNAVLERLAAAHLKELQALEPVLADSLKRLHRMHPPRAGRRVAG